MFKASFFLILTLLISVVSHARPLKLSHPEFVHLTDAQKNEWIIKTMELMVELESRYQREIKTTHISPERREEISRVLHKIQNFLMSSAYAAPARSWESYGQSFSNLLKNSGNGKSCIYAGWVSKVVTQNGKDICIHPAFLGSSTPEAQAYNKSSGCEGRNKISCNPAIFGFKSEGSQTLFCVNAGLNESHNSSYNCMKAALTEEEGTDSDSKEVRLRNLRERLAQSPAIFEEVRKFVFQTCLCENSSEKLSQSYHQYMRPHRTCYGLMEMLGASACEEPKVDFDTTFFTKLTEFTNGRIITSSSGSEVDSLYTNYINQIKGSSSEEFARLCPADANDSITVGKETPEIDPGNTEVPPIVPITDLDTVTATVGTITYSCTATCSSPEASADEETSSARTCEFTFKSNVDGEEEVATSSTEPTYEHPALDATSVGVTATFNNKSENLSCSIDSPVSDVVEETVEGDKPTISLSLKEKTVATQKVVAVVENREGYKVKWFRKGFPKSDETKPVKAATPEKTGLAGDSGSDEAPTEDKAAETTETPSIPGSDDQLEIEEPLKAESYQTCAKLEAEGKDSSAEACVTIPKLTTPETKAQGGLNRPAQPMQQPRGGTNTSALGIR